jgi:molybdopterin converting factor small subunit
VIEIQVARFNSLRRPGAPLTPSRLVLPDGATVGDALERLEADGERPFLVLLNGRNILRGVGPQAGVERDIPLRHGDRLALSGPIPFSRGYGSPVV